MCILFILISRILRYDSLSVISIEINTLPELFKFYIKMFYTILCRALEKIITNCLFIFPAICAVSVSHKINCKLVAVLCGFKFLERLYMGAKNKKKKRQKLVPYYFFSSMYLRRRMTHKLYIFIVSTLLHIALSRS